MRKPHWSAARYPLLLASLLTAPVTHTRAVDFARDVRPILAGKCYQCHGPDEEARQADLRLDDFAAATSELPSGARAISPGDPAGSELIVRISSTEPGHAMPPAETGKALSPPEIETLRAWIAEGAVYARHWAYVSPVRPRIPAARDSAWPRNPIDNFVLTRLEAEGLSPTEPAERQALARRVALDLTGLPPSPGELREFLIDATPEAYERFVDRLLAKTSFGERWATMWLDQARYADSQGYAPDGPRTIWRWRDWVIQAFNENVPYDQFTIAQLAGDLLPEGRPLDVVATGFHRNTQLNTEGGVNLEEFRHAAVVDRVNTTFAVWMGSTLACAQCHHHKYDPFSQREYYQIFAIFNNTDDFNTDNPIVESARVGREADFARLKEEVKAAQTAWDVATPARDALQAEWEETVGHGSLPKEIVELLAVLPEARDARQREKIADYHRALSTEWKALDDRLKTAKTEFDETSTTVPVMREGTPRPSFVYSRGEFLSPGEAVTPGVPAALHPAPADVKLDRLGLAQWIMAPENPLTARVAVNRFWQELFGVGLVETAEEFGTQGEPPSHPELLDWLAVEYRKTGWDTKRLLKLIVTSATYQQSAKLSDELRERDPNNRLLARGPRVRLSGETIRDQALATSGLLSAKMYGPPVQPPQPSLGLAAAFGSSTDWKASEGEDGHRRAIYTRWRRNLPYPSLVAFDAPERNVCSLRRMRTNTPLQALVTLNDPVYVECAQALARRAMSEGGLETATRARQMIRLVLGREATPREASELISLFESSKAGLGQDSAGAMALATTPLGPLPEGTNEFEAAAWTIVANVVLNLDETLTKP